MKTILDIALLISSVVPLIFCVFGIVRTHYICKFRLAALKILSKDVLEEFNKGNFSVSLNEKFIKYPSCLNMLLDLRKWTFKQFFPDLEG